jgi:CO/xanthine dehydrogenase Mo-binding subunit
VVATTHGVGYDRGVGGARITRLIGTILEHEMKALGERLRALLAGELGVDLATLELVPGGLRTADGRAFSLAETASLSPDPLLETLTYTATERDNSVVYLCEAAEVELDPETGQVTPRRLVSVHEVGRVIRPDLFQGQVEGGVAQGLGFALMEGLQVEEGRVTTTNLHEYKLPTQPDLPPLDVVLLPPDLSLGITPIGEGPNNGVAPAIANALVDLLGTHTFDLPLQPEQVLRACQEHLARTVD